MRVGPNELHSIQNIKGFLTEIGQQEPFEYAPGLIYAQELYSFPSETDEVLQLLMKSQRVTNEYVLQEDILLIAASDWEQLLSLLTKVSAVRFMQDEILYEGVQFGSELVLSFEFDEANKAIPSCATSFWSPRRSRSRPTISFHWPRHDWPRVCGMRGDPSASSIPSSWVAG